MKPNESFFKIINETPLKGGGSEWEVEYSDDFKELYKKDTGKKRVHEKSMGKWFVDIIAKGVQHDDSLQKNQ